MIAQGTPVLYLQLAGCHTVHLACDSTHTPRTACEGCVFEMRAERWGLAVAGLHHAGIQRCCGCRHQIPWRSQLPLTARDKGSPLQRLLQRQRTTQPGRVANADATHRRV